LRSGDATCHEEAEKAAQTAHAPTTDEDVDGGGAGLIGCALCKTTFYNVQDQRQHVRSDFHRYNLKLQIKGLAPVSEATFIKQIGDLDESISGSESEESDEDEGPKSTEDSTLTALLKRQVKLSQYENDGADTVRRKPVGAGNAPLLWLHSPKAGEDVALGVYKALLSENEKEEAKTSLVELLKRKQVKPVHGKQSGPSSALKSLPASDPHFFLCMIGGGHFAASIVSLIPEFRKGPGGVEEHHPIVKAHKTFHRYTTRRKQGGSQSANDNAKGNAHSAGSSIRRYNEAALETDARSVLAEWKNMIDSAKLLFVRATGTTSRRTLFGPYDGQVLQVKDQRLRGFPFNTRRPTQAELLRSFSELTRLKVSTLTEVAVEAPAEKPATKPSKPKPAPVKLSKEEEAALLHTSQLQTLIRRTKAPGLLLYVTKNELSPDFRFHPEAEHHHAPTPLHLSASTNSPALVLALLTKANADPTLVNGDGRTAYQIAGDTKTRDAFRLARHTLGESGIDWAAAHVPSALSPEEVEARSQKEKAADDAAEMERRKADLDRIAKEEEAQNAGRIEKKAGPGKSLGVVEKTGSEKREEEGRGLTPEMRMRLERERRARAAEERMRRMAR
jgi:Bacteroidetes VLRF1 release factor/Ankyrin repeats (many copies)